MDNLTHVCFVILSNAFSSYIGKLNTPCKHRIHKQVNIAVKMGSVYVCVTVCLYIHHTITNSDFLSNICNL